MPRVWLAEQTVDQHHAALRFMEEGLHGKPLDRLAIRDVGRVRSALMGALDEEY